MSNYNPNIHHRRSIRLKGYDFSQTGFYFVTIATQNRLDLFGEIKNGEMIEKWYAELENKFPDIKNHEMTIMPNHCHCIIEIVGADLCVCPNANADTTTNKQQTNMGEQPMTTGKQPMISGEQPTIMGEHVGSPLHRVVQWFKTMTTNEYIRNVKSNNWQRFNGKLWQRNYWEHIIRNENEYNRISQYIIENPIKWDLDKLNMENSL